MDQTPEQLFLENLPLIERLIKFAVRRYHFSPEEAEDFGGKVMEKLIEDGYARIRKWKGKSSLPTFLGTVVNRLALDYTDHLWGKWTPSAEATRLGPVALQLDKLTSRDGRTFDEACEILRTNHHVELSVAELREIWVQLPPRSPRQMAGEEELEKVPDRRDSPDDGLRAEERQETRRRVHAALKKALAELPAEDHVIIRMTSDLKTVEIARVLGLDQKRLYRRIEKIKAFLRKILEEEGISAQDIEEALGVYEE